MMKTNRSKSVFPQIYKTVQQIPRGTVATYGQIARLAGLPRQARLVGYALHALPQNSGVPWHRVINAKGEISQLPDPDSKSIQQALLEAEGIEFDRRGKVNLKHVLWDA